MLLIGFAQSSPAQTLCAYLNEQNLVARVQPSGDEYQIYLRDEQDLEAAKAITRRFLQNPNAPEFAGLAWQGATPVSLPGQATGNWFKHVLAFVGQTPVTALVLLLCLASYFLVFAMGQFQLYNAMSFLPFTAAFEVAEFWRPLTPTLIHFSIFHLVFNLMWWGIFGRQVEQKLGHSFLLLLYLATGLLSNYAQFWMSGPAFGGLSGVVYGLLGFCWWLGWLRPDLGITLQKPLVAMMLLWLIIGYADVLWINMANTAHTVGLVTGCLLAYVYAKLFPVKQA